MAITTTKNKGTVTRRPLSTSTQNPPSSAPSVNASRILDTLNQRTPSIEQGPDLPTYLGMRGNRMPGIEQGPDLPTYLGMRDNVQQAQPEPRREVTEPETRREVTESEVPTTKADKTTTPDRVETGPGATAKTLGRLDVTTPAEQETQPEEPIPEEDTIDSPRELWDRIYENTRQSASTFGAGAADIGQDIAGKTGADVGRAVGGVAGGAVGAVSGLLGGLFNVGENIVGLDQNTITNLLSQGSLTAEQAIGAYELLTEDPERRRALAEYERSRQQLVAMQQQGDVASPEYAALDARTKELEAATLAGYGLASSGPGKVIRNESPLQGIRRVGQLFTATPQERSAAWEAGRAGLYTGLNLPALAYERIMAGEDPETVVQETNQYQNVAKEMLGQAVLDPADLTVGVVAKGIARGISEGRTWSLYVRNVDHIPDSAIEASLRTGERADRVARMTPDEMTRLVTKPIGTLEQLNPMRPTSASRRALVFGDATDVVMQVAAGGATDAERAARVADFMADPQGFARRNNFPLAASEFGRRAAIVLRKVDDNGGVMGMLTDAAKQADEKGLTGPARYDLMAEQLLGGLHKVSEELIPDRFTVYERAATAINRVPGLAALNRGLASLFMGVSPGYALKNALNNFVTITVDGMAPFESLGDITEFWRAWGRHDRFWTDFGSHPLAAHRGLGPIGIEAKKGWYNYFLRRSQDIEKFFSERVTYRGTAKAMRDLWPRRLRARIAEIEPYLDGPQRRALFFNLQGALNETQFRVGLIKTLRTPGGGMAVSDALMTKLEQSNAGLATQLRNILGTSVNPAQARARVDAELRPAIQRFQAADADAPILRDSGAGQTMQEMVSSGADPGIAEFFARKYRPAWEQYHGVKQVASDLVAYLQRSGNPYYQRAATRWLEVVQAQGAAIKRALDMPNGAAKDRAVLQAAQAATTAYRELANIIQREAGVRAREVAGGQLVWINDPRRYVQGEMAEYLGGQPSTAINEQAAETLANTPAFQQRVEQLRGQLRDSFKLTEEQSQAAIGVAEQQARRVAALTGDPAKGMEELNNLVIQRGEVTPGALQQAPGSLPKMTDNTLKPLTFYAPRVYHQTDASGLRDLISDVGNSLVGEKYVANTPDLALSQRPNAGIMLELDTNALRGVVNTQKPSWQFAYDNGTAEFVVRHASQRDFTEHIASITIEPGFKADKVDRAIIRRYLRDLEAAGWQVEDLADGSRRYTNSTVLRQGGVYDVGKWAGPPDYDRAQQVFASIVAHRRPGRISRPKSIEELQPWDNAWIAPSGEAVSVENHIMPEILDPYGHLLGSEDSRSIMGVMFRDGWVRAKESSGVEIGPVTDRTLELVQRYGDRWFERTSFPLAVDITATGMDSGPTRTIRITEESWRNPNFELRSELTRATQTLLQGEAVPRGQFIVDKGKQIVSALENADVSTAIHELTHASMDSWIRTVVDNNLNDTDLNWIEKELGRSTGVEIVDHKWSREPNGHMEVFADMVERYLRDGQAPSSRWAAAFKTIRGWFVAIYRRVKGTRLDTAISPQLREILDAQFGEPMARRLDPESIAQKASAPQPTVEATPVHALSDTEQLLNQIMDDVAANYGQSTATNRIPPEVLTRWTNDMLSDLNTVKTMAWRAGTNARDFALLDYTDRRAIDPLLSTFLIYPFWASRTYPRWAMRALQHPAVVAAYLRFQRHNREQNQDLPEWAQNLIKLPFTVPGLPDPVYINARAIVDPLYNLFTNFEDEDLSTTWLGRTIQNVDETGFSLHPLFSYLLAAERYKAGKPEEAEAALGHLASATRLIRYATGWMGANEGMGVTPEFWLWKGGVGIGGDKWEIRRAQAILSTMQQTGEITPEEARRAAYAFSQGDYNNPIVRRTLAEEIDKRFGPTLFSYFTGANIRTFPAEEQALNEAYAAQSDIWARQAELSSEEWSQAWKDFYQKYPFMETLSIARSDRLQGDTKWVYDVLGRLPPGQSTDILESVGISSDLIDEFYTNKGFVDKEGNETLKETDRMRLVAAALDLAEQYNVPSTAMNAQWEAVRQAYSDMYDTADRKFAGARALETQYYEVKASDPEAAKKFIEDNPVLETYWDWKDDYRRTNPLLQWFYGQSPREQAISYIWDQYFAVPKGQRGDFMAQFGSDFKDNFLGKKYDSITDAQFFDVMTYLGATMYRSTQAEAPGEQTVAPRDIRVTSASQMGPSAQAILQQLEAR